MISTESVLNVSPVKVYLMLMGVSLSHWRGSSIAFMVTELDEGVYEDAGLSLDTDFDAES